MRHSFTVRCSRVYSIFLFVMLGLEQTKRRKNTKHQRKVICLNVVWGCHKLLCRDVVMHIIKLCNINLGSTPYNIMNTMGKKNEYFFSLLYFVFPCLVPFPT